VVSLRGGLTKSPVFRLHVALSRNPLKKILSALLPLIVLLAASCNRASEVGLHPGDKAPGFQLMDLDGNPHQLSDYLGKVVLLNFWASWCAPCIEEMPSLQRLYSRLEKKGFVVLSVAVDDVPEALTGFRRKYSLSFPVLLDTTAAIKKRYKVKGYPETFIIDTEGRMKLFSDPSTHMPTVRIIGPRRWDSPSAVSRISELIGKESSN